MSLILEALKKSETRRRLGEAPDLGTPFTVTRRRRNPLPLIVVLIAVAAGFGWWYARTMPPKTDANTVASKPSPPASAAGGSNPVNAQQAGQQVTRASPLMPARDVTTVQTQATPDASVPAMTAKPRAEGGVVAPKAPGGAEGGAVAPKTPGGVADLQAMRATNRHLPIPATPAAATATATANQKPPAAPAAIVPPPITRATTPGAPAPAPAPPPVTPATDSSVAAPAQVNDAKTSSDPAANKPADAGPALPQYYELAYGVRKDIPPFALSMHVFAADAPARFVVVDGERKVEGDSVKEGLVLREIRPDGMVLEFRGQRFFYPRPGH